MMIIHGCGHRLVYLRLHLRLRGRSWSGCRHDRLRCRRRPLLRVANQVRDLRRCVHLRLVVLR